MRKSYVEVPLNEHIKDLWERYHSISTVQSSIQNRCARENIRLTASEVRQILRKQGFTIAEPSARYLSKEPVRVKRPIEEFEVPKLDGQKLQFAINLLADDVHESAVATQIGIDTQEITLLRQQWKEIVDKLRPLALFDRAPFLVQIMRGELLPV